MAEAPKPYMPYVAQEVDRWRSEARALRFQASKFIVQAEVLEDAAIKLEIALDKEKRTAEGKPDER